MGHYRPSSCVSPGAAAARADSLLANVSYGEQLATTPTGLTSFLGSGLPLHQVLSISNGDSTAGGTGIYDFTDSGSQLEFHIATNYYLSPGPNIAFAAGEEVQSPPASAPVSFTPTRSILMSVSISNALILAPSSADCDATFVLYANPDGTQYRELYRYQNEGVSALSTTFSYPLTANVPYEFSQNIYTYNAQANDTGTSSVDVRFTPIPTLPGDTDGNNHVDLNDLNTVLNHLGMTDSLRLDGNFDAAPTIDLNDLNEVLNNLGTTAAPPAAATVPEPASIALLCLCVALSKCIVTDRQRQKGKYLMRPLLSVSVRGSRWLPPVAPSK